MRECAFCDAPAAWLHTLDPERSQFRIYGKGHTWADEIAVCETCEQLYRDGDDDGLVAVENRERALARDDADEQLRRPLAVFRAADTGAIPMAQWLPPGTAELTAAGFVPLDELTGNDEMIRDWPEPHRRSVPETRAKVQEFAIDGQCWLLRSPWPAVPVQDVVDLIWDWEDLRHSRRISGPVTATDHDRWAAARREFFELDEEAVLKFRRAQRGGAEP
jgi:hypothetical protein